MIILNGDMWLKKLHNLVNQKISDHFLSDLFLIYVLRLLSFILREIIILITRHSKVPSAVYFHIVILFIIMIILIKCSYRPFSEVPDIPYTIKSCVLPK